MKRAEKCKLFFALFAQTVGRSVVCLALTDQSKICFPLSIEGFCFSTVVCVHSFDPCKNVWQWGGSKKSRKGVTILILTDKQKEKQSLKATISQISADTSDTSAVRQFFSENRACPHLHEQQAHTFVQWRLVDWSRQTVLRLTIPWNGQEKIVYLQEVAQPLTENYWSSNVRPPSLGSRQKTADNCQQKKNCAKRRDCWPANKYRYASFLFLLFLLSIVFFSSAVASWRLQQRWPSPPSPSPPPVWTSSPQSATAHDEQAGRRERWPDEWLLVVMVIVVANFESQLSLYLGQSTDCRWAYQS